MDMLLNRIYVCEYKPFKCDHTFKETKIVLSCLYLDVDKSIAFLEEHGGYCDCQVMQTVMKGGKGSMRKLKKKDYSFTEATEIVNKRDEEICQNCGNIVLSPCIARLSGAPQDFNPDNFILVCGRCKQIATKKLMEKQYYHDGYDK